MVNSESAAGILAKVPAPVVKPGIQTTLCKIDVNVNVKVIHAGKVTSTTAKRSAKIAINKGTQQLRGFVFEDIAVIAYYIELASGTCGLPKLAAD